MRADNKTAAPLVDICYSVLIGLVVDSLEQTER